MPVKDLGNIPHKLLLFGGVYGNLHALKALKKIADREKFTPAQVIFNGDAAAYCAFPEKCVQFIKDWNIHGIAGNVEIQLRDGSDDCGCNFDDGTTCDKLSDRWYPYVQQNISRSSLEWMNCLCDCIKFEMNGYTVTVVHGSFRNVSQYIFKSTDWSVKEKEFKAAETDIIIGGHCGLPFSDQQNERLWANTGALGMPANDGTSRVWYLMMEPFKDNRILLEHRSFEYENKQSAAAIEKEGLPDEYRKTLLNGIWDNCDILAEPETRQQGKRLSINPSFYG